jgi:hypothetical protein
VTAAPVPPAGVEVRPHRTRAGRLDYVTVQREPDGVVRVLGWYSTRSSAQRALEDRGAGVLPFLLRAAAAVLREVSRPLAPSR